MRLAVLRGMLSATGLKAGFFIGTNDELIVFQGTASPLASV
jgi:hypothetical protein